MPETRTYDPNEVTIVVGAILVDGFADGTFVSVEWDEDAFTKTIGAGGEVCRARSNNNGASVTLTLLQSSAANDLLSALHNADKLSPGGDGIVPFIMKDGTGRTVISAEKCWVRKPATVTYGREVENREWTIDTGDMVPANIGGNN